MPHLTRRTFHRTVAIGPVIPSARHLLLPAPCTRREPAAPIWRPHPYRLALHWLVRLHAHDAATAAHGVRVAAMSMWLAGRLDLPLAERRALYFAALLHDIGKLAVPRMVLQKANGLTTPEWQLIRQHPQLGHDLLAASPTLRPVAPLVLAHHERWDGGGYPNRLRTLAIPLGARILTVGDAWDAMTFDRPYQRALSSEVARERLLAEGGLQFDPEIVGVLAACCPPPGARAREAIGGRSSL